MECMQSNSAPFPAGCLSAAAVCSCRMSRLQNHMQRLLPYVCTCSRSCMNCCCPPMFTHLPCSCCVASPWLEHLPMLCLLLRHCKSAHAVPLDLAPHACTSYPQIILLLREVYRGFSARADRQVLPGGDKGLMRSTAHLHFTRWDSGKPPTVDNLVLLTAEEAAAHDMQDLQELARDEPAFVQAVERLLDAVRAQVMY
eukprot:GHRQ01021739.1.p1 GENE.GHRQ01021739.1~~GHRQ01021739.1.p1  ORF type:complete len:198 (+),score=47.22 GHRQ01021739.1:569-1162(+)